MPSKTDQTSKQSKSKVSKKQYIPAVGRRKEAIARVRLFHGKGETTVNGQPIGEYFFGPIDEATYLKPFKVTGTSGKFYMTVKVIGSGKKGQLGALVHGLARALDKQNTELYHQPLKQAGLLTRDSRTRERRKPGMGGKARRKRQSPKR
ncbi:30S ribosomal protein S9 [Candidatus Shapirobacteria bacterium CG09_land_8_20_14_0_10_49_15]|uniref:Small ribosomal subunit protein uS9 n=2 Tax=Candidatus Shapironibacteriota TaxID=1752721 RepID=A0A2M8L6S7_9BACT|nr:MAG: 30S ribosomal protein S9 [Candidatus Shapirobacteria bacterium CG09_land_8_20_14_0_10_49_15]PJE69936.1 MAG: 30S ribosomal protein S9 [Candidatus Shapirobacteria bacterium CG10_big_fil_rev_8_21_14_0_10_48_15]